MARYRVGFLPYGSDDEDVVLRHPLTSLPSATDLGFGARALVGAAAGATFDPVRGMRSSPDGVNGCFYRFTSPGAPIQLLQDQGQITFEVETQWLGATAAGLTGSNGYAVPIAEGALNCRSGAGSYRPIEFYKQSNNIADGDFGPGSLASTPCFGGPVDTGGSAGGSLVNTVGKGPYTKVQLSWSGGPTGGRAYVAFDDLIVLSQARSFVGGSGNIFNQFVLGSRGNTTDCMISHYMRNIQIAKRAPVFPISDTFARIGVLSDSLVDTGFSSPNAPLTFLANTFGESSWAIQTLRLLNRAGIYIERYYEEERNSHTITDSGANQLTTYRQAVLNSLPRVVMINGGTNDAIQGFDPTTMINDYIDHIHFFLGIGAYTANTYKVPCVVVNTAPFGRWFVNNGFTLITENNRLIRTLPQLVAQTAGGAGRVFVNDVFNYVHLQKQIPFGSPEIFIDDFHFNAVGNILAAEVTAKTFLENIRG